VTVDKKTYDAVQKVIAMANKRGMDIVEALDGAMLLMTPARHQQLVEYTLTNLWQRLDAQHPSNIMSVFLGRNYGTPDDMYRAILDWLEAVINHKEEGRNG